MAASIPAMIAMLGARHSQKLLDEERARQDRENDLRRNPETVSELNSEEN
jgi:hypothetical protein